MIKKPQPHRPSKLNLALTLCLLAALTVAYTWVEFVQPPAPIYTFLSLLLAALAVITLKVAGFSFADLRLRYARLSRSGGWLLLAATLLMLPILASSTGFAGWRTLPALVYAPGSGIAQELFFRAALLPALERLIPGKRLVPLLVHTAIFVLWHLRTFTLLPSFPFILLVAAVLSLAGMAWGGQVQRDDTVIWSAAQHSLFLSVMSLFDWV